MGRDPWPLWLCVWRVTSLGNPSSWHCARATQLLLKKCRSGGESLAKLCPIWLVQNMNLNNYCSRDKRVTAQPTWFLLTPSEKFIKDFVRQQGDIWNSTVVCGATLGLNINDKSILSAMLFLKIYAPVYAYNGSTGMVFPIVHLTCSVFCWSLVQECDSERFQISEDMWKCKLTRVGPHRCS